MSGEMIGIALGLLSALGFGASPLLVRIGLRYVRTTTGTLVSMLAALLVVGAIAIPLHAEEMLALPLVAFGWFAVLGLVNYPVGRFLNFTSVRLAGVARSSHLVYSKKSAH